jgi:DNA-binding NarL/FixJ family response regulator
LKAIESFKQKGVQVVTLDSNLNTPYSRPGDDGREILEKIKEIHPEVKVISLSIDPIEGADAKISKMDVETLENIVTNL